VRHIVELHGGTVTAESPGEGRGATFTIRLPVRAVQQQALPGLAHAGASGVPVPGDSRNGLVSTLEGARVLVVDDEIDARDLVKTVLETHGAAVTTVASASEAIDCLKGGAFEVLVADIGMPDEDGYALIRRVREISTIPAIALTAYGREEDRVRALAAGYERHVTKPVAPNVLVEVVASALGAEPT
jgi:CheY-like chemotaxis protein